MKSLRELLAPGTDQVMDQLGDTQWGGAERSGLKPAEAGQDSSLQPSVIIDKKVLCVWGTGGSGATSLSANLAAEYASRGQKTLLVDFDLDDPSLVIHFGVGDFPAGLVAAARLAGQGRLDYLSLDELSLKIPIKGSLRVLPGITAPGRFRDLSQTGISALMTEAKLLFDIVVIDLGARRTGDDFIAGLHQLVIEQSDEVLGVFSAEPEGIAKLMWRSPVGRLVANRYRPGLLGMNGKKKLSQTLAELTECPLIAIVSESEDLDMAITDAKPLRELVRKSQYLTEVGQLLELLNLGGANNFQSGS